MQIFTLLFLLPNFAVLAQEPAATAAETIEAPAVPAPEEPLDADAPAPSVEMAVTVEMPELEDQAENNEAILNELKLLRQEFQQLQETLDLLVGQMMADVEQENLQLRHEVQRLHSNGNEVPYVPGGNSELLNQVLSQPLPTEMLEEGETADGDVFSAPPGTAAALNVVQEWGRSPEAAKALGDRVSTLKGVVGTVPVGSDQGSLEQLGRELRQKYDGYDNINVEVFDDAEAAKQFAERQVSNPEHRVLSVSKHKDSGRDVILVMLGGQTYEVAP